MMLGYVNNALKSLKKCRIRAALTSLSVAIGVFSVVIISIISDMGISSVETTLTEMGMDNLVISGSRTNESGLDGNDLEIIKAQNGVINAMPLMYKVTTCESNTASHECMVWGVNEDANEVIELKAIYGRLLNLGDVSQSARVCIIDKELAQMSFGRKNVIGKTITVKLSGSYIKYEIVGVVENGVNMLQSMLGNIIPNFIYIPYKSMQAVTNQQYFNEIAVKINGDSQRSALAIESALSTVKPDEGAVSVENLVAQKDMLSSLFDAISGVLSVIAGVSLIVSGMSIMTIMTVSVNERTKEIGIKKSIGAKNSDILFEFIFESAIISLGGALAGALLGCTMAALGCILLETKISIDIGAIIATMAVSVIIGLLFSVFPALKAARLKPVEALRRD
ncbi:MAG: ABC transporter permease [Oscillospiraceae bacterium]|nr:ABC transporter permease [Oscillospiraceae bacterium]